MKTITPEKQTKQERMETIHKCVHMLCDHFNKAYPNDKPTRFHAVFDDVQQRNKNGRRARAAIWKHMLDCGCYYSEIERCFKKSYDCIYGVNELKVIESFSMRDMEFLRNLPEIKTGRLP